MIQGIINAASAWFFNGVTDEYVNIRHSSPKEDAVKEIPQSLRERDIPDFGKDQERMLQMAVKNFNDEELQVKWLHSMHQLRFGTGSGWIGEKPVQHVRQRGNVARPGAFTIPGMIILEDFDTYVHQDRVPGEGVRMMSQIDHERINKLFEEISKPVPVATRRGLTLVK
jgi:hypothetical protein